MIFTAMGYLLHLLELDAALDIPSRMFLFSSILFNMIFGTTLMMSMTCGYRQLKSLNQSLGNSAIFPHQVSNEVLLKRVANIFDTVCDIFDAISKFYLLNILGFLVGFTYFNIFFVFGIFLNFKLRTWKMIYFSATSVCWLFYFSPLVIYITIIASRIETEGRRTVNIMHELINVQGQTKDLKILNILVQQASHRSPRISCGLFYLNWKFFFSMLGGIFSFSIILIQFYDVAKQ